MLPPSAFRICTFFPAECIYVLHIIHFININQLVFVMKAQFASCEVGTEFKLDELYASKG
jgi:hypothetical protein